MSLFDQYIELHALTITVYSVGQSLKWPWYHDKNCIFPMEAILKVNQVACMRRKMLFTI